MFLSGMFLGVALNRQQERKESEVMMTPEINNERTLTPEEQLKKPYVKPQTRRVELRPQEAVLGNCKQAGEALCIGQASLGS